MVFPKITFDDSVLLDREAFGALIQSDGPSVTLPESLHAVVEDLHVRNILELLAAIEQSPSYFLNRLHWSDEDLHHADQTLRDRLRAAYPELPAVERASPDTMRRRYGAIPSRKSRSR